MSKGKIIPFQYGGCPIRAIRDDAGEPWFVGHEVCRILGYARPNDAVAAHCKLAKILKYGETTLLNVPPRGLLIIPESDLYRLIMRSRMPDAETFKDWVTEEVLPRIRKTGGYLAGEEAASEDELVCRALLVLQRRVDARRSQIERQETRLIEQAHELLWSRLVG